MSDRLQYNTDGETLDEVVMHNADVHLEQLNDHVFMLIVENKKHHWHLRVGTKGRGKVDAWVLENSDEALQEKDNDIKSKVVKSNETFGLLDEPIGRLNDRESMMLFCNDLMLPVESDRFCPVSKIWKERTRILRIALAREGRREE